MTQQQLEVVETEVTTDTPKKTRKVNRSLALSRLKFSREMLEGTLKDYPEANREFFLERLYKDLLHNFPDPAEIHALIDEAYEFHDNEEARKQEAHIAELASNPEQLELMKKAVAEAEKAKKTAKKA